MKPVIGVRKRRSFAKIPEIHDLPNLIDIQIRSFDWLLGEGLAEIFKEFSPIEDFSGKYALEFGEHSFGDIKFPVDICKEKGLSYAAPLLVKTKLINKETGEVMSPKSDVFMGDFCLMTEKGTFVVNGTERVIVSQLVRSPGVYFGQEQEKTSDKLIYTAKIIPNRGAWLEYEIDKKDIAYARLDRKRKLPITVILKALGFGTEDDILALFNGSEVIKKTLAADSTENEDRALEEIYKKLRPGEPPTPDSARNLINSLYFDANRYDLGRVGRYKLKKKLNVDIDNKVGTLTKDDIIESIRYILELHKESDGYNIDDIDHFGNRRVKSIGELIQNQFRIGMTRMEKTAKERMTTLEVHQITPPNLINVRPIVAAMKEFFGSSQLSQFMDQTNPLSGLTHKRRLSALGPGGLSRERAGFEVRDVHPSHYGRMCPIETPEGPNIGLIGTLASYARVNNFGFIETPYRKVEKGRVTDEIVYLTADDEFKYKIAQANAEFSEKTGKFKGDKVLVRKIDRGESKIDMIPANEVDYMDVSPRQIVSVAAALIPFLEHNDANRALMGANMQRQAVPLLRTEAPLVGTGVEHRAIKDTGELIVAKHDGTVKYVSSEKIVLEAKGKKEEYVLHKFRRSNQGTCISQKPIVSVGEKVTAGQVLADGPCSDGGELGLGKNLLVAFMTWEGYNFEDAIVLSERIVKDDVLTSIHIEEYEVDARDTKLGAEEITRDVPNISEEAAKDLDEFGIIRIGAEVRPGDVLVGKVTPKGETELTAEERLLRAIFGEKAKEVRDTSLKVPHGEGGRVIDVRVFSRGSGDDLNPGVNQQVKVFVAQKRKISVGDKLAGRHGNKGVISRIVPEEDMPFLEDGTPVDIILNPLGVPSRMNIGQVLETHLGWAAAKGWSDNGGKGAGPLHVATPVFDGATESEIKHALTKAGLPASGKAVLYNGRTGEKYKEEITVGQIYMLKLLHLVDDKIHARSTGPYSLVTQQPLGGKAQFGGQRFGEMEVWALEAYGSAHTLQEILTVKSDDVSGRVETYEAIVKGQNIPEPKTPESFKVLIKEMQSLGLRVDTDEALEETKKGTEEVSEAELFFSEEELASIDAKAEEIMLSEDVADDGGATELELAGDAEPELGEIAGLTTTEETIEEEIDIPDELGEEIAEDADHEDEGEDA